MKKLLRFFRLVKCRYGEMESCFPRFFPILPENEAGTPQKWRFGRFIHVKKATFFSSPMNLHFYLSDYIFLLWKTHRKTLGCDEFGGFLARHPELRAGLPLGCSPRITTSSPDHYIDTFLGDRTSQSKSSIFRLLSRDCTPGKLT